ncbi:helix-turn-helix transcriptional regulator [Rhodococcus sp. NPDC056960]|uniref:helix-turn-helix transcriptional regulator n=1 Tax=Rhodococcus sp. NPDC056960 TaxID=3345982 RepID=UPI0036370C2B
MSKPSLNIHQVSDVTGHSPQTIRKMRTQSWMAQHGPHPLYSKGFKPGEGITSALRWRASDVDEFMNTVMADAARWSA